MPRTVFNDQKFPGSPAKLMLAENRSHSLQLVDDGVLDLRAESATLRQQTTATVMPNAPLSKHLIENTAGDGVKSSRKMEHFPSPRVSPLKPLSTSPTPKILFSAQATIKPLQIGSKRKRRQPRKQVPLARKEAVLELEEEKSDDSDEDDDGSSNSSPSVIDVVGDDQKIKFRSGPEFVLPPIFDVASCGLQPSPPSPRKHLTKWLALSCSTDSGETETAGSNSRLTGLETFSNSQMLNKLSVIKAANDEIISAQKRHITVRANRSFREIRKNQKDVKVKGSTGISGKCRSDGSMIVKGNWTDAEDEHLSDMVNYFLGVKQDPKGIASTRWSEIAKELPGRVGKQCRERWHNHLRPDINKGKWTFAEEVIIFICWRIWNSQWARISRILDGRSDNRVKNHWNCHMKRRLARDPAYSDVMEKALESITEAGIFQPDEDSDDLFRANLSPEIDKFLSGHHDELSRLHLRDRVLLHSGREKPEKEHPRPSSQLDRITSSKPSPRKSRQAKLLE